MPGSSDHHGFPALAGALLLSALVIFGWQALSPLQWGLMIAMGGAGGHFMLVKAFHSAVVRCVGWMPAVGDDSEKRSQ